MGDKPIRLLMIEDDEDYATMVRLCLAEPDGMRLFFEIDVASRLAEGLQKLAASRYDAALVDLGLPDADGLDSARAVLAAAPDMPVLVATNQGDESSGLEAMRLGAQDYMIKASSDSRLLKRSIRYAIERKTAQLAREEVVRREKLKDQWIGTLSHELRTPLALIKSSVSELLDGAAGPLLPQQTMLAQIAARHSDRLIRLVVNLLDLSRMESGVVSPRLAPVDARDVAARVVRDFARAASDRALEFETDFPAEPVRMAADLEMFEQLLVNLVDNALRFAHTRVVVRLRGGPSVELAVSDDGVGIPKDKLGLLFTRYLQLLRGPEAGYKGTGLGLAICKQIVELHGGEIRAESSPGKGTTFVAVIPADAARTPPPRRLSEAA
ncbi:MAG: hybrid sensor histidine kinase/response regulator [Elusimicrobiota bacterium]|nr:MAG: hybrid sensor histidine kinase/response regulator [Elusimicrobiota bacterium]